MAFCSTLSFLFAGFTNWTVVPPCPSNVVQEWNHASPALTLSQDSLDALGRRRKKLTTFQHQIVPLSLE